MAPVTTGKDGADRIVIATRSYTAGIVREVATGCQDEPAARSLLGTPEHRAELVEGEVLTAAEDAVIDHQEKSLADRVAAYLKMGRHQKRFCDLQKIVLRLGLFQFPLAPENGVDVYYREVLEKMSWREKGIENRPEQYQEQYQRPTDRPDDVGKLCRRKSPFLSPRSPLPRIRFLPF